MSSVSVFTPISYTLEKGWEGGGGGGGSGSVYNNLYGEILPNRVHLSIQERLFHVIFFLSTFEIEKLSSWHH